MDIFVWIWLAVVVLTLVVEFLTTEIVSVWFFVGSFVSLILALCKVDSVIQCWVFIGVSLLFLITVRPFLKKWIKRNEIKTNVDTIIGKVAFATKDIFPNQRGEVKIDYATWSAVSDQEIKVGEEVTILAIDGNKLIVKKDNNNNTFESKGE